MNEERAKEILEELGWKGIDKPNDVGIVYSDHTDNGSTGAKNYVDYTVTQNIGKKECCVRNEEQEGKQ